MGKEVKTKKVIEDSVRKYIQLEIMSYEQDVPKGALYNIYTKWFGYIHGVYAAFVITDDPDDESVYEVTFDPNYNENVIHVRRYLAMKDRAFDINDL